MTDDHRPLPELLALIRRTLEDLPDGDVAQAAEEAETADTKLTAILNGTNNETAKRSLSDTAQGRDRLESAQRYLSDFRTELTTYLHGLGGAGPAPASGPDGAGQPPSGIAPPAGAGASPATTEPASTGEPMPVSEPDFDPQPLLDDMPKFVRKRGTRTKTHGRYRDDQGELQGLVSGEKLANGEDDPVYLAAREKAFDLRLSKRPWALMTAADVELKFAVTMCPGQRAKLVVNNPDGPCQDRLGCNNLLAQFLPPGAELTVYWPGGSQKTYRGKPAKS